MDLVFGHLNAHSPVSLHFVSFVIFLALFCTYGQTILRPRSITLSVFFCTFVIKTYPVLIPSIRPSCPYPLQTWLPLPLLLPRVGGLEFDTPTRISLHTHTTRPLHLHQAEDTRETGTTRVMRMKMQRRNLHQGKELLLR